jgi:hypothetical protein
MIPSQMRLTPHQDENIVPTTSDTSCHLCSRNNDLHALKKNKFHFTFYRIKLKYDSNTDVVYCCSKCLTTMNDDDYEIIEKLPKRS